LVGEPVDPEMVSPQELSSFEVKIAILNGEVFATNEPLMVMPAAGELVNLMTVPPSIVVVPERVTAIDET